MDGDPIPLHVHPVGSFQVQKNILASIKIHVRKYIVSILPIKLLRPHAARFLKVK